MSGIFELVGTYKELYALATDAEEDERQLFDDTLEAVMGEIEDKAEGYVAVIDRLDMELAACEKHRDEWDHKLKVRKNAIKRLKERMAEAMLQMGKTEIQAGDNVIRLKKNGGQLPVIINGDVPAQYLKTKILEEKDDKKIREALDSGIKLDFAAYGQRGVHIRIE